MKELAYYCCLCEYHLHQHDLGHCILKDAHIQPKIPNILLVLATFSGRVVLFILCILIRYHCSVYFQRHIFHSLCVFLLVLCAPTRLQFQDCSDALLVINEVFLMYPSVPYAGLSDVLRVLCSPLRSCLRKSNVK